LIEKVLSSRKVYDGELIKVRLDLLSLPNGKTKTREVVEHPSTVAVLPILSQDKIVMIQQYRHPTGKILLEIPAGTLRPGESPEECAGRELAEEAGFKAGKLEEMFQCYLAPGYSSELMHIYLATNLSRAARSPDSDEFIKVQIVGIDEALRKIGKREIEDAKTIAAILYAKRFYRSA
jgi:ADP-ribose pyrophosphatase